jgi:hypothetical protein
MTMQQGTALPVAWITLRILIVLNWVYGTAILALLIASITFDQWTMTALGVPLSAEGRRMMIGMRAIAALGIVTVPFNFAILKRLLAMVETVRAGDPFVAANAGRLQAIAWSLLALQVLSLMIAAIAKAVSTPDHPLHLDAGFSTTGWLAVVLTFVLARVFAEGARMREDLEGTV